LILKEPDTTARSRASEQTRRRVLDIAEHLGYTVNPVARNLVGGRNRLLGVYTFEAAFPIEARDSYQEFFVGIEHEAELAGYDLLLFTSTAMPGHRRGLYAWRWALLPARPSRGAGKDWP
jgi:LacI family transcriptional regulator